MSFARPLQRIPTNIRINLISPEMAIQGHPKSLILVPIESEYICNFLLVINSNIGPILPRFRDIAGFRLRRWATPPLFHPNFAGVPLGIDCRCCGSSRVINFELVQPTIPQRYGRTDGQTTYDSNTALSTTGWSKKRGHSTFSQISRKLLKISKWFLHTSRQVYA